MVELLLKLEMSLWINETRNKKEYMNIILHPDFYEIGQSAKRYTKEDILNDTNLDLQPKFPLKDISIKEISEDTYLITYFINYECDGIKKASYRTSIWLNKEDIFQLYFHQGTKASI